MMSVTRRWRRAAVAGVAALICGCAALQPGNAPNPTLHALGDAAHAGNTPAAPAAAPVLAVSTPHAAAGFDSRRMVYLRHAGQPEFYAYNEWVDTPARMLAPLIVTVIERSGAFRAAVLIPGAALGDMRLDTEVLHLQQEFTGAPSRVRFTLRAHLLDSATRRVIASHDFEAVVAAASEDAAGGAAAANQAVHDVLGQLAAFCARAAGEMRVGVNRNAAQK